MLVFFFCFANNRATTVSKQPTLIREVVSFSVAVTGGELSSQIGDS
jgi:hypothetical protein